VEVCFAGTKCAALPTSEGQRCFPDAVRCPDVSRMAIRFLMFAISCSAPLLAQKPAAPTASGVQEFPVIMRQNITAGKTPVGSEVQAKLMVGTIGDGTVFPTNAIFSGRVIDHVANTSTEPSRLAIGHGLRTVKGRIRCGKDLPDRLNLPHDCGVGPGSPIRAAAVSGRDLER
jgi:hypothetical protein